MEESKHQYSQLQLSVEVQKDRFLEMQNVYEQEARSHETEKEKVEREKIELEASFQIVEQNHKITTVDAR